MPILIRARVTTTALLFFSIIQTRGYVNPRNPCHDKTDLGKGSTCLVYTLPPQMCAQCRLKPAGPFGKYPNCKSIFDIQTPNCKHQLRKYAQRNPCDALRGRQIADVEAHLEALDFFIYAICEACCDCVPVGSAESDFKQRRNGGTLFNVASRANCGTHVAADVCKVWPGVRAVVTRASERPGGAELDELPNVCPALQEWRRARGDAESGLSQADRDTVPGIAQPFLSNFLKRAGCHRKRVWKTCVSLERNQSRI